MSNRRTQDDALPSRVGLVTMTLAGLLVCGGIIAIRFLRWETVRLPFVRPDIAMVHLLAAAPLAGLLAMTILRRTSLAGSFVVAGLILMLGMITLSSTATMTQTTAATPALATGVVLRGLVALGFVLAAVTVASAVVAHKDQYRLGTFEGTRLGLIFLSVLVLFVAPAIYLMARSNDDLNRLTRLLNQSRLGEARSLAIALFQLNPDATWEGHPLPDVVADLNQKVQLLELRVNDPLPIQATNLERVARAQDLAIIGRTTAALKLLEAIPDRTDVPEIWNLQGTIHEARQEWLAGCESYHQAKRAWESLAHAPESNSHRVRALTGIAYCERKMGHYAQAEAAYLELLSLSPTADTHFLLAQFYEDSQRATKAQSHARQAMAMAPERYSEAGMKLIDKLVTLHFGCWSVFVAEGGSSR